jgi:hypothetical protein
MIQMGESEKRKKEVLRKEHYRDGHSGSNNAKS